MKRIYASWPSAEPPMALGVPYGHPARSAAERLESALGLDFEARVKDRVLKEQPRLTDNEWKWTWFELKRYFLMCAIMRSVPMYSRSADAIWHEMLMFTREYEQFCSGFSGEMIHHAPHAAGVQSEPGERAWFDWVYGELFEQTPVSGRVWGTFYRTPLPQSKLSEIELWSEQQLKDGWFNGKASLKHGDLSDTIGHLIGRLKRQVGEAKQRRIITRQDRSSRNGIYDDPALMMLSGMLIFNSLHHSDDFARQMDNLQTEEERKANSSGDSTYACSGSSHDGRHDGGHDGHSGGHGGDSSCGGGGSGGGGSSCGGGCGGGGD
ncbi:hypothetical protein [Paenibacillus harenae]|uniref:hypothetical protein n=1 Tax=Paenibacillus harenae TaxID=306543 RepID=UPI00278D44BB|nr:hypothetical protein [Paenibacillus harenae]MDQ0061957.1 putative membrane protein YgcG [Paenibacillus harenae]